MAMKIHNMKFAIIHKLVMLKKKHQRLDASIDKANPEYQRNHIKLLKRLENMGLKP